MSMYLIGGLIFLVISVMLSLMGNYSMFKEVVYLMDYYFVSMGNFDVVYEIVVDWVSCLYLGVVFLISGSVLVYSEDYMYMDSNKNRFFLLMIMFVLSMMFMVISSGLISVLLGWDGLGLVSYCLVIYYGSISSYKAGMITISMNRVGDALLLVSIGWVCMFYMDSNYWFFGYESFFIINMIMWMVIVAACTKSAQIPFSAWLPEASAAPTPVSSLVHSSTLVTAGVFLLIRFNYFFLNYSMILLVLSLMTMLMAGSGALVEKDMKKVVAMSTLSQLGLSMFSLSLGLWKIAFFHMVIHAFFKALMFLCVGNFIHGMSGNQDFRFMSMKFKSSWLMNQGLMISIMCLSGFPFLCGFFSKDLLLELVLSAEKNSFMFMIFMSGFSLSILYGSRLYIGVLLKINLESSYMNYSESKWMNMGVCIMMLPAILSGSSLGWGLNFYNLIMLSNFWKLSGVVLILILFIYSVMFEGEISKIEKEGNESWSWNYIGSLWFLSSTSGAMWKILFEGIKVVEMGDQGWGEENSGGGLKEGFFKNFLIFFQKFQLVNYFYMVLFSCMLMLFFLF